MKDEDEEAAQAQLCFAEFSTGEGRGGVEILIKYSKWSYSKLEEEKKGLNTCIGKEMGCFKK